MDTEPGPIVIATHNPGKVADWAALFEGTSWRVEPYSGPSPDEDADTYEGNARIKALVALARTGQRTVGDDSGMAIDAMDGAPGLYTRPWAEERGGFAAACRELVRRALGSRATYWCGVAWADPDGTVVTALEKTEGHIAQPVGPGPGLEPVFVPDGADRPLAALPPAERLRFHCRGRAWTALLERITAG